MSSVKAQALGQKIADKTVRLATVGLGYVGLPLSVEFASAGLRVVGIDIVALEFVWQVTAPDTEIHTPTRELIEHGEIFGI